MNLVEMFKLYRLYRKGEAIQNSGGNLTTKISQYLTLALSLIGTIGAPTFAENWLHTHVAVYTGFVAAAIVLHALFPSLFSSPSKDDEKNTGLNKFGLLLIALLIPAGVHAQTPTAISNFYGAGMSYSVNAQPSFSGTALQAHLLGSTGTYEFSVVDALPNTVKPFTVTTNIGVGIAQKIATFGKVSIFMPTAAGVSFSGTNTGWQWNGGVMAPIHLTSEYYIAPSVRFLKSSVSNGSSYQPIVGLIFGWGK